jgi:hypothetical protein
MMSKLPRSDEFPDAICGQNRAGIHGLAGGLLVLLGFAANPSDARMVQGAALVPPGIPAPVFCLQEKAPSVPVNWAAKARPDYYFVDNSHKHATDSGNPFGSPARPRKSLPTRLAPGSYVEIHGGPYTSNSTLTMEAAGTAAQPVWIRGAGSDRRPILRLPLNLQGTYLFIENLFFDTNHRTLAISSSAHAATNHICVRNTELAGPGTAVGNNAAISIAGNADFPVSDVVLFENSIHDFGDRRSQVENDYHGILPGAYARNIWLLHNQVFHMGGDAIQVGQAHFSRSQRPQGIFIGGNVLHEDRENAVDIKAAADVIVSGNTMYGYRATSSSSGEIVVIHDDPASVWILFNHIRDGEYGLITTDSADTWFIGNVVHDIHHRGKKWSPTSIYDPGAAIHFRGDSTGGAVNNTLFDYDIGIQAPKGGGLTGYEIRNNVFSGRSEPLGMDVRVDRNAARLESNLFAAPGGNVRIGWNSTRAMGLPEFKSISGQCRKCIESASSPLLAASKGDFRISNRTAAASGGTPSGAFEDFRRRYGVSIDVDFTGRVIRNESSRHVGAYQAETP